MRNKRWMSVLLAFAIILLVASFYTLPFYVQKPGSAFSLDEIVEVEGSSHSQGEFSLMTVSQVQANAFAYIWAKFDNYQSIYPVDQVRNPHESEQEYSLRQSYLMDDSSSQAIEVAFTKADADFSYTYRGVYVLNVYPDMPAEDLLNAGDRITAIDDLKFESSEEFIEYVAQKKEGDKVKITIERDEETYNEVLSLQAFPDIPSQIGLGISLVDDRIVNTDPKVSIDSDGIGGPSAGLMYSLEIYDQLIEEDLTKGYNIAGTGTITSEGEVGRIGGIEQKVVAADRQGIEIFFAPDDKISSNILEQNPDIKTNYEEADATAKNIKSSMKVIPVKTFEDALNYLDSLDEKS
ncbi:SepM family pheromone-processing serine protease [Jeotgalibacillus marinus]|uniref:endopeptidase La n=1 Tax=Jeotgalibacillus marinus TaxID=86667 RepID=A0ABV3Q3J5_9BACL